MLFGEASGDWSQWRRRVIGPDKFPIAGGAQSAALIAPGNERLGQVATRISQFVAARGNE